MVMDNEIKAAPVKHLNDEMSLDITAHFPFPQARPTQAQALTAVQRWLHGPKKFFILEGPTGFGKSGIGIAAASYAKTVPTYGNFMPGGYILSPQKTLTEQYMKDFAQNGLVELKGQSNYFCPEFDMDCEAASLVFEEMHNHDTCFGYKPAKQTFVDHPMGVTNFAYYLAETTTAHQLPDRTLLVCDEGHNCEDLILGFTDTNITQKKCDEFDAGILPIFAEGDVDKVREWLNNVFVPATQGKYRQIRNEFQIAREQGDKEAKAKAAKRINGIDKFLQRIALFVNADQPNEWFAYSDWDEKRKKGSKDLIIKPLTARLFADQILFSKAQKVLIMSATILDFATFMRNLGIDPADAEILAVDSEFPVEHRPIFFDEVGDMRFKDIDSTLPFMATRIEELMERYGKYKGIVHTQSYKINKYFVDYLRMKGNDRILTHAGDVKGSREAAVLEHCADMTKPTVLFSPSMQEGLDLKEDRARWGVVCKVPYPALDPYIKARMQKDPDWYLWLTALKLVQETGRIVRSNTDKAHTWILDSGFRSFLARAKGKLPRWWTDSIVDMKKVRGR
jgi:Rad3-related DNA helicase